MFSKELGEPGFGDFTSSDGQHDLDELGIGCLEVDAVHLEENQGGSGSGPIVGVYERMVFHNVEEVGRRHLEELAMEVLFACARLGHRQGGLKQPYVAHTSAAPVAFDLIGVNLEDLV